MDFVYYNPPSPTRIYETSTLYSLQATRFAGPSAEQEQISQDERPLRQVLKLDYLPDATSYPKESENGARRHEIGEDAGRQAEEGDLTFAFENLTVRWGWGWAVYLGPETSTMMPAGDVPQCIRILRKM